METLLEKVAVGKTYALYRTQNSSYKSIKLNKTYFVKLTPPKYTVVKDTVVISPALNGEMDTSNYFIQTEVLVLKEPGAEWRTASLSSACNTNKAKASLALCLLKTTPKYKIINKKFFPFKNILDTTDADFIIPAKVIIVDRYIMVQKATIEILESRPNTITKDTKIVPISKGSYSGWTEVVCPFGKFNAPLITDVQKALKKEGYNVNVTGNYDEQTKMELHSFQRDNMLEEGEITPQTLARLNIKQETLIQVD